MNDYDPKNQSAFISYLDMNNLYSWTMFQYLPYEGFKWLKNINEFDVMSISEKRTKGYLLKVDFDYSDKLHELHNDYPQLQKNLLFLAICCWNIVKKFLISMR